jgi:hypothetical protein
MKYISKKSCIFKKLRQNISDVMNTDIPTARLPLSLYAARIRGPSRRGLLPLHIYWHSRRIMRFLDCGPMAGGSNANKLEDINSW